jgi:hypothetical protein
MDWLIVIAAALLSGLLGVAISVIYYRRHEKYLMKLRTLKDFAGYRYDLHGDSFTRAINEIFIVFSESTKVKQALKRFHENSLSPTRNEVLSSQYLVELYKAMCEDLNIKTSDFTDNFFLTAFNVKKGVAIVKQQIPQPKNPEK